jgi:hypothetical protein
MKTKVCSKCNITKNVDNFDKDNRSKIGIQSVCKNCRKIYRATHKEQSKQSQQKWNLENKEYVQIKKKHYREINKNEIKEIKRKWYLQNQEKIITKRKQDYKSNKAKILEKGKQYRETHKHERNQREMKRRKTNSLYKFTINIRNLICSSLKRQGYNKSTRSYNILGDLFENVWNFLLDNAKIRYPDFKEEDFLENNKYHIDHIVPLATAKNEEEVIRLCHYKNLQLLTKEENLTKHDKIDWK